MILGWDDAGHVGIDGVDYLIDQLEAEEFGGIEPHRFSMLPYSIIKRGVLQEIEYPQHGFYYWKNKNSASDLILFSSAPPAVNHHEFANLILDVAEQFRVGRIYTVGGIHTNIVHTEEPRVSAVVNNTVLREYARSHKITMGLDYHGPTSMNGLILGMAKIRNIEGISLWGWIPGYISDMPNPRVSTAVLRKLTAMLAIDIDFGELEKEARYASKQIDELVEYIREKSPELDRHIEKLEKGIETTEAERQLFFDEIDEYLEKEKGWKENDASS